MLLVRGAMVGNAMLLGRDAMVGNAMPLVRDAMEGNAMLLLRGAMVASRTRVPIVLICHCGTRKIQGRPSTEGGRRGGYFQFSECLIFLYFYNIWLFCGIGQLEESGCGRPQ